MQPVWRSQHTEDRCESCRLAESMNIIARQSRRSCEYSLNSSRKRSKEMPLSVSCQARIRFFSVLYQSTTIAVFLTCNALTVIRHMVRYIYLECDPSIANENLLQHPLLRSQLSKLLMPERP